MATAEPFVAEEVSVVIPARDEEGSIARAVRGALSAIPAGVRAQVIVADDGSRDRTAAAARDAGARVVSVPRGDTGGSPGRARNEGARHASGDPIVFLDADCAPEPGWLETILRAHASGAAAVGGSLELPEGASLTVRLDYYDAAYHVHPRRRRTVVPNHTPANLSVRREVFRATRGFEERHPEADGHEELGWQAELRSMGGSIVFEPAAVVRHANRSGLANLLRRSYRWGFGAPAAKRRAGNVRLAFVYRSPVLFAVAAIPAAPIVALYVAGCWARAGRFEPLLLYPGLLLARLAWAAGCIAGSVPGAGHRGGERRR